jgi:hypothetical protein
MVAKVKLCKCQNHFFSLILSFSQFTERALGFGIQEKPPFGGFLILVIVASNY